MADKSVMLSIKPQYCALIAWGEKTLEVRKNHPRMQTPFKCYIYCTSVKSLNLSDYVELHKNTFGAIDDWSGKVIGEFVCDDIKCIDVPYPAYQGELDKQILEESCLTYYQLHRYAYHDALYGWHISNVVIYDKPKEISDFLVEADKTFDYPPLTKLKKPPTSWCYIEGVQ